MMTNKGQPWRWVIWVAVIGGTLFLLLQITEFAHAQEKFLPIHKLELEQHANEPPVYRDLQKPAVLLPLLHRATVPSWVIYGYLPYWSSADYLNYYLLTTIAYFGAEFDGSGNVLSRHGWPVWSLVNKAHSHGVRVDLVAICFNRSRIHSILTNATARTRFIQNAVAEVKRGNGDGLNVDFEMPSGSDSKALSAFMAALTDSFHAAIPGSKVTIATPAVDWNNAFDRRALAQNCDGMMIMGYDYHWSGSAYAGAVAPLTGGSYNVTNTVADYLYTSNGHREKLILGVPYYGYEWKTESNKPGSRVIGKVGSRTYQKAETAAQTYGKRWDSVTQTPWYTFNDGTHWHQCWYDDSLSLSLKYNLVLAKKLAGIGIWALGYDGSRKELWGALRDHFVSSLDSLPPFEPTHFYVLALADGRIAVGFRPVPGASGYLISKSLDGSHFDSGTLVPDTVAVFQNLQPDTVYYFRVQAVNSAGKSDPTEILAATTRKKAADFLIVNGFDRMSGTRNTRDFVRQHAEALGPRDVAFSSSSNEAVISGQVDLQDFSSVDWILGEEGTETESFSAAEQALVKAYLKNGGNLFVSGSEIGYDLVQKGTAEDQQFYRNFLKATYVSDRAGRVHEASGTSNGIFHDLLHIQFDDGTHGGYDVDYPDGILPVGGSLLSMTYDGVPVETKGGAGIQYAGLFDTGTRPGRLVYLGFPFEMIVDAAQRAAVMGRVLDFFNGQNGVVQSSYDIPQRFVLEPNYPNPISKTGGLTTTIQFTAPSAAPVTIRLFNLLGQQVRVLYRGKSRIGENRIRVRLNGLPAGTYFYAIQLAGKTAKGRLVLVR